MSRGNKKKRPHKQQQGHQSPRKGQWDLLNKTADALFDYAALPTEVAGMLRNPDAMAKVENRPLLAARAKLLCDDCTTMTSELISIRKEHEGKRGEPKNADEHMRCVDIHTRYVDWAERYEAVVFPTYVTINEQVGRDLGVELMEQKPTVAIANESAAKEGLPE